MAMGEPHPTCAHGAHCLDMHPHTNSYRSPAPASATAEGCCGTSASYTRQSAPQLKLRACQHSRPCRPCRPYHQTRRQQCRSTSTWQSCQCSAVGCNTCHSPHTGAGADNVQPHSSACIATPSTVILSKPKMLRAQPCPVLVSIPRHTSDRSAHNGGTFAFQQSALIGSKG